MAILRKLKLKDYSAAYEYIATPNIELADIISNTIMNYKGSLSQVPLFMIELENGIVLEFASEKDNARFTLEKCLDTYLYFEMYEKCAEIQKFIIGKQL